MKRVACAWLAVPIVLSGCGASYVSPTIGPEAAGASVKVIPLTVATVSEANAVPYTPQTLPSVFFPKFSEGQDVRRITSLPEQPLDAPSLPKLDMRLPPEIVAEPYRLGVSDVVMLTTQAAETTAAGISGLLTAPPDQPTFPIKEDGTITLPSLGSVRLVGLTLKEAETELFDQFLANQIDPAFSLRIIEYNSQKIAVGGAVKYAKLLPVVDVAPTISEALAAAGGIDVRDRSYASVRIYRGGELFQIPVGALLSQTQIQSIRLMPGDAIFVDTAYDLDRAQEYFQNQLDIIAARSSEKKTAQLVLESELKLRRASLAEARAAFVMRQELDPDQRDFVFLTGEVDNLGRRPLPFGKHASLVDILYGGGGFSSETGDPSQIYVLRKTDRSITAWHLDATNTAALVVAQDMQMRPGDIIFVEEQKITKFGRALDQALPALIGAAGRAATQ